MSKFKFRGYATIGHLNARKEGPDEDKELAVDLKLSTECDDSILDMLGDNLREFLFLPSGAVRNEMLGPLTFSVSFKPSGDEVARMAEYLQDAIEINLEPANDELDLDGKGAPS